MTNAPDVVDDKQLEELNLDVVLPKEEQECEERNICKCMDFIRSTLSGVVIVNNLGKLFTFITAACYLFITAGCIWGRLWQ